MVLHRGSGDTMNAVKFTPDMVTDGIKGGVRAVLIAHAFAETMRAEVDKVYLEILTECPVYADQFDNTRQILKVNDLYLCSDKDLCQDVYDEAHVRLRAARLKPADMDRDKCPALVAERLLVDTEHILVLAAEEVFEGVTLEKLICAGMGKYRKWIDLLCGLVVSLPDFRNPLTGKG